MQVSVGEPNRYIRRKKNGRYGAHFYLEDITSAQVLTPVQSCIFRHI